MSLKGELGTLARDLAAEAKVRAKEAIAFKDAGMRVDFQLAIGEGRGLIFAAQRILKRAHEL